MSHIRNATFSGNVAGDPEYRQVGSNEVQDIAVFAQNRRKVDGEYQSVGDDELIRVQLWNEKIDRSVGKGDLVQVTASFSVQRFQKRDGTPGFAFQTDFVDSFEVKISKSSTNTGYAAADTSAGFDSTQVGF